MIRWDQIEPYFDRLIKALETLAKNGSEQLRLEKEGREELKAIAQSQVDMTREALEEGRLHSSVLELIRAGENYKLTMTAETTSGEVDLVEYQEAARRDLLTSALRAEYEMGS